MNNMRKLVSRFSVLTWVTALLLSALAAGCGGGGGGGQDPILGGGGNVAPVVAPAVTVTTPLPNDTGVPINVKTITAAFTKAMDPATLTAASFTLACPAGTAVTGTAVAYLAAGNVATLTLPAANLPANTVCTATVTTGAKDTGGVPLAANFTWTFTTAAAADVTRPTVTGTVNANGATNVAVNTKVGATFSEAMNPTTITATTFTLTQGATPVAGTVSYTGVSAVFTPASNLAANTVYTATITTGATDVAGNALAANYVWSWTTAATADTTAPTVTGTIHANGATNVAINTKVGVTFSEVMDPSTITNANFMLKATASGTAVAGVVSYSGVNAVFVPLSNLAPSTNYTVTVKGGASGVTDLAGNPMASDFVISWTTAAAADTTAPTVTGTTNANGATGVPINTKAGATFSEGMDPLTITNLTFTLNETVSGAAVAGTTSYSGVNAVFAPASNLKASTKYTATITTGAKDLAGNALAANYVWSWTTAATPDTTPPTVTGTINANGATGVSISTKAGATFSEAMDPLTITNLTFTLKDPAGTAVAGTMSYSGVNAVFTPTSTLAPNTVYTATVTTGVKDLAGNAMAANFVWSWTTGAAPDTTAPTVTLTNPADLAVGVCVNKTINATFSEAMDPLTITTATFTLAPTATPAAAVTGVVTYDAATKIATFNPVANLTGTPATSYTATIKSGVSGAKDVAGNALAADKVWAFTTNASTCTTAPVLGAAAPFGGFGGNATLTSDGVNTVINGDIGVNAASTKITGLTDSGGNVYTITPTNSGLVNGLVYTLTAPPGSVAGAAVTQARADALLAFNSLSPVSLPGGIDVSLPAQCPSCGGGAPAGPSQLGGRTLPPGIYLSATGTYSIGALGDPAGNLTLDAGGDANAVWVFQTAAGTGSLTVGLTGPATPAVPVQVLLINGAQAKNVFWYVPAGATIGTGATMVGTMLSDAAITMSTTGTPPLAVTTTVNGRAIALTAGVTMTNTVINVPAP